MIAPLSALGSLPVVTGASPVSPSPVSTTNFADALGSVASKGLSTLGQAEAVAAQGLTGEASARQVADAVMSAEQSLQSAIAVRDKVTAAWLEISRMAI